MSSKRVTFGVVVALIAVAYVGGYWPERQRRAEAETELAAFQALVTDFEAREQVAALLGDVLTLTEEVLVMNYGQARELSSQFFDRVQAESTSLRESAFGPVLADVARKRDEVTASLARGDQQALGPLRQVQILLREALGYPSPPPGARMLPPPQAQAPADPPAAPPSPVGQ